MAGFLKAHLNTFCTEKMCCEKENRKTMQLSITKKEENLHSSLRSTCIWKGLFLYFLFLCFQPIHAQEQLGWHLQQYAGINSIALNPAGPATYPHAWDINLVAFQAFTASNYTYLEETSILRLLTNPIQSENFYLQSDITDGAKPGPDDYVINFFNYKKKGYDVVSANMMGPSFSIRLGEQHTLGLFTRARAWVGTQNLPSTFAYYSYYSRFIGDQFEAAPFSISGLSWSEVGLNYTLSVPMNTGTLALGISAKALQGYESAYLVNERSFTITHLPSDSLSGSNFTFEGGLTTSALTEDDLKPRVNGNGLGVDLGVQYIQGDGSGAYNWRLGFSLLDIGRINFNENAEAHRAVGENYTSLGLRDYNDLKEPEEVLDKIKLFSHQSLGDSTASFQGNSFGMWLPSALSIQADFNLGKGLFIGGALVQGVPLAKNAPNRGSLLGLGPRYEQRWFGASLPVSIYNWKSVQVGMAVRLAFLTLGTDDIGSWVSRGDLSGGSIYMALKVPFFGFSSGEDRGGRNRGGGNVKCYTF